MRNGLVKMAKYQLYFSKVQRNRRITSVFAAVSSEEFV